MGLSVGCETRREEPTPPTLTSGRAYAPRLLPGTYALGPTGVIGITHPETPLVYVDLEVAGPTVSCHAWRPDGEVVCEASTWLDGQLRLELLRKYEDSAHEERRERWIFTGSLSEDASGGQFLDGRLHVVELGEQDALLRQQAFRIVSPKLEVDADALAASYHGAREARLLRESRNEEEPPEVAPGNGATGEGPLPPEPEKGKR